MDSREKEIMHDRRASEMSNAVSGRSHVNYDTSVRAEVAQPQIREDVRSHV